MKDSYGQAAPIDKKNPHYEREELPFYGDVALGNWTRFTIGMFAVPRGRLFVAIEGRSCFAFSWAFVSWQYANEKLQLKNESDARFVADFINGQTGSMTGVPQGEYVDKLVLEKE